MSPAKFCEDHEQEARRVINGARPSPLRIKKNSLVIQKSSSSHVAATKQQKPMENYIKQRDPIIIYTHSPKVIHIKACDFMALVQKLTGLSRPIDDTTEPPNTIKTSRSVSYDIDNESSSVLSNENYGCGHGGGDCKGSLYAVSPIFNTHHSYISDMDNESSSVLTDENSGGGNGSDDNCKGSLCAVSPVFNTHHPHFSDIDNESSSILTDENCDDGDGGSDCKDSLCAISPLFNTHPLYFSEIPSYTPNSNDFFSSPGFRYVDHMITSSLNMKNSMSPSVLNVMKDLPQPNSNDFFSSPGFRYVDHMITSSLNMENSMSPPVLKVMKELPESGDEMVCVLKD